MDNIDNINKTSISKFLNMDVVDFANYSTVRAIASYLDGLKNSHRKVIHFIKDVPSNKEKRLFNLSGEIMTATEYLHGDISGSVVTLAQNFTGSNNISLLKREGNFGSRFTPEASATRYIYTTKEDYFDDIFLPIDNNILIEQEFEGKKIEPRFFLPSVPLILVNGSEGIATGFAQKILPRNTQTIKQYIKNYLNAEKTPDLKPSFNGFKGTIEKGENKNQWIVKGEFIRKTKTEIIITEIPIGYNLSSYTKVLDKLEDDKIIKTYEDLSENDEFKFKIKTDMKFSSYSDEEILDKLKLKKKITENFTVIDENNRVRVFNNAEELIQSYIDIKIHYTNKRKEYLINKIKDDLHILASKYIFVDNVIKGNIIVNNKKKTEIEEQLEKYEKIIKKDDAYDYLLRMPIYTLTEEKVQDLHNSIIQKKKDLDSIKSKSEKDLWLNDLEKIQKE